MLSVLVVGGGFAGIVVAQALRKSDKLKVTLVDRKDYFEVTPAQLRALVDPESIGTRSRIAYRDLVRDSFVHGEVVDVESNSARLSDESVLDFDTLVLAPGTRYPRFPVAKPLGQTTAKLRQEHNQVEYERFKSASSYLIVVGGLVGVELAGELASHAPGKAVRLAHSGFRLVENLDLKASSLALAQLRKLGVDVELNTGDARPVNGEIVYVTVSPEPMTDFLRSVRPGILDPRGRIQVDSYFRVKGFEHWFAIGDANDFPEGKQASTAGAQGAFVAKAILGALSSGAPRLKPYRAHPIMALAPIGRTRGFAQMPFGVVTWKILVDIKRKDLLAGMFRRKLGV